MRERISKHTDLVGIVAAIGHYHMDQGRENIPPIISAVFLQQEIPDNFISILNEHRSRVFYRLPIRFLTEFLETIEDSPNSGDPSAENLREFLAGKIDALGEIASIPDTFSEEIHKLTRSSHRG